MSSCLYVLFWGCWVACSLLCVSSTTSSVADAGGHQLLGVTHSIDDLFRRRLIVGGAAADVSTYPWAVFIGAKKGAVTSGHCSGSIISPGVVLTAAHCVFHETGSLVMSVSMLRVHVGATDWREAHIVRGVKSVQAPSWQGWVGDFALLYLDECLPDGHPTVRLATPEGGLGDDRTATNLVGWGVVDTSISPAVMSNTLRHLETSTSLVTECSNVASSWALQYDSNKELCFASLPLGAGICSGDSGAPLVSFSDAIGEWVQIGVVAYGPGICGSGPDFAVRVSYYIETLLALVGEDVCISEPEMLRSMLLDSNPGEPSAIPTAVPIRNPPPIPSPPPNPPPPNPPPPLTPLQPPPSPSTPSPNTPYAPSSTHAAPDITPSSDVQTIQPTQGPTTWQPPMPTATPAVGATDIPSGTIVLESPYPTPTDTPDSTTPLSTPLPDFGSLITPTPMPSTPMAPVEVSTSPPMETSDPTPSCASALSECPDGMVLRMDNLQACTCVFPMVVSFVVTVLPTEWNPEWTQRLLEALVHELDMESSSHVYLEHAVSISQHQGPHATLTVTFLALPYPDTHWSSSQLESTADQLQHGSVFLTIPNIQVIEIRDLAVYSRGGTDSIGTGEVAYIVVGAILGFLLLVVLSWLLVLRRMKCLLPTGSECDQAGNEAEHLPLAGQNMQSSTPLQNARNWLRVSMGSLEVGTGWFQTVLNTSQSTSSAWEQMSCSTPDKSNPSVCTSTQFELHGDVETAPAFFDDMRVHPIDNECHAETACESVLQSSGKSSVVVVPVDGSQLSNINLGQEISKNVFNSLSEVSSLQQADVPQNGTTSSSDIPGAIALPVPEVLTAYGGQSFSYDVVKCASDMDPGTAELPDSKHFHIDMSSEVTADQKTRIMDISNSSGPKRVLLEDETRADISISVPVCNQSCISDRLDSGFATDEMVTPGPVCSVEAQQSETYITDDTMPDAQN